MRIEWFGWNAEHCKFLKSFRMHWKYPRLMFVDLYCFSSYNCNLICTAIHFIILVGNAILQPGSSFAVKCYEKNEHWTLNTPNTSNPIKIKCEKLGMVLCYMQCSVHGVVLLVHTNILYSEYAKHQLDHDFFLHHYIVMRIQEQQ